MFSHLFNTYESVTPPPKSKKKDFMDQIWDMPEPKLNPFDSIIDISSTSNLPDVEPPSDEAFILRQFPDSEDQPDYSSNTNQLIDNIISTGRSLVGGKYVYGGTSPKSGLDCSSFIQYIYKQNGIDIPRDTSGQFKVGKEVSYSAMQPGDIICTKGSGKSGRHVQMVSRIDNGQVYVLEAKGSKWGIVEEPLRKKASDIITIRRVIDSYNPEISSDPFLANQDIKTPSSGKFNSKENFIRALNTGYRKALASRGLDPNYSYILTAQAALESGWGKHLAGKYNFGGIKISDKEAKEHPERASRKMTTDWSNTKGYFKHYQNFRNFYSIDDFCNFKVNLLCNNRYDAFNGISSSRPYDFVFRIMQRGYGSDSGGPESRKYTQNVIRNYNKILNILKS